jgi:hypothetical protein
LLLFSNVFLLIKQADIAGFENIADSFYDRRYKPAFLFYGKLINKAK